MSGILVLVGYLLFAGGFFSGFAVGRRRERRLMDFIRARAFKEGRRSERDDERREPILVRMTTGDGSFDRPFRSDYHFQDCPAVRGRDCECRATIMGRDA